MHSFISKFDMWLVLAGSIFLVICLFGIRYLFKADGIDEIDPHEEMLWRILDKGEK